MPSVFTLEGAQGFDPGIMAPNTRGSVDASGSSGLMVVNYPPWGQPLAPTGTPIGPARPETPVYGPGGTPIQPRYRYPPRGPIHDYNYPPKQITLGDSSTFLSSQPTGIGVALMIGGALLGGIALGGASLLVRRKLLRNEAKKGY